MPHPVVFGQSANGDRDRCPISKHTENVVHLQFMWTIPVTNKFELAVMVGPSFFTVRQTVATVHAPQDIADPPPYTTSPSTPSP